MQTLSSQFPELEASFADCELFVLGRHEIEKPLEVDADEADDMVNIDASSASASSITNIVAAGQSLTENSVNTLVRALEPHRQGDTLFFIND